MPEITIGSLYVSAVDMDNLIDRGVYQDDIRDMLEEKAREWVFDFVKQKLKQ